MDGHNSINPHLFDMMVAIGFDDLPSAMKSLDRYIKTQIPSWMENEPIDPVSERDFLHALDALLGLVAIANRNGLLQLPTIGNIPGISRSAGTSPGLARILKSLDHVRDRMEQRLHQDFDIDDPYRIDDPLSRTPTFHPSKEKME